MLIYWIKATRRYITGFKVLTDIISYRHKIAAPVGQTHNFQVHDIRRLRVRVLYKNAVRTYLENRGGRPRLDVKDNTFCKNRTRRAQQPDRRVVSGQRVFVG